jgi:hypothetical protein
VALGWNLASVVNDLLRAPGSTPLYLCLPPILGAAGGDLLNPHYLWNRCGNQKERKINRSSAPERKEGLPFKEFPMRYFSRRLEAPVYH